VRRFITHKTKSLVSLANRKPLASVRLPNTLESGCFHDAKICKTEEVQKNSNLNEKSVLLVWQPFRKFCQTNKKSEKLKEDLDKILDEIDEILSEDSEEFVENYIQGSGQ